MTNTAAKTQGPVTPATNENEPTATRRRMLVTGAALGLGASGLGLPRLAEPASASQESTPAVCTLTPQMTEGPYYIEDMLVRQNIFENQQGTPLQLKIAVSDASRCAPLANAAVDIWHCDAEGYYSGITGENPGGGETTFLRGVQLTDENGVATFDTIYPGWYPGRAVHIHLMVHVDGEAAQTYDGGHVVHTGQLYFEDAISDAVFATGLYAERANGERVRNAEDFILRDHEDEPGVMVNLTSVDDAEISSGFLGAVSVAVNAAAAA